MIRYAHHKVTGYKLQLTVAAFLQPTTYNLQLIFYGGKKP